MPSKSPKIDKFTIPLPITAEMRHLAHQFAARQPTKGKAEQVLLNTIAVSVVNNYLTMLGISTELSDSDSWNPVMQLCGNVADLDIPGVGKLECRPIKNTADRCRIPLEVWHLRIGYVVVVIDDTLRKAEILGFASQVTTEELAIANLRPPEALIERIHELKTSPINNLINLGQWLNNIFEAGWQTIDSLLKPQQLTPTLSLRNAEGLNSDSPAEDKRVARAKLMDFGIQFRECQIVLLVELDPEENGNIGVTIRLYPQPNEMYLPEALNLKVLEVSDKVFMEAQSRTRDNYIQLQFSGQPEEIFQVEITLDDYTLSEQFQL